MSSGNGCRGLGEPQQDDITAAGLLSGINGSKHAHMRELRVQSGGRAPSGVLRLRPQAIGAILRIGGETGDDRFYERMVPVADALYDTHIEEIGKEALIR